MFKLEDAPVSGEKLSQTEKNKLEELLGVPTCTNNLVARIVDLFSVAFMITFFYLVLELSPVNYYLVCYIPDREYRLLGKTLLIFVFAFIFDRIMINLRRDIVICDFQ